MISLCMSQRKRLGASQLELPGIMAKPPCVALRRHVVSGRVVGDNAPYRERMHDMTPQPQAKEATRQIAVRLPLSLINEINALVAESEDEEPSFSMMVRSVIREGVNARRKAKRSKP